MGKERNEGEHQHTGGETPELDYDRRPIQESG